MDTETEKDLLEEELEEQEAAEKDEKPETEVADETAYTPEKQQLDQERANARRAREELATITSAYEQSTSQIEQLKQDMANIQAAKETEKDKLEDMDPEMADEKVINNIRRLDQRLAGKEKQLDEALKKIQAYEQQQQEAEQQKANARAKEAVLLTVEKTLKKMGVSGAAKYRNEANSLADELVDSGQRVKPNTFTEAIDLMTDCYLQIKDKAKKKKTVSVDTGRAGAGVTGKKSGIKPGTLDNVREQMLADRSWLQD